MTLVPTGRLGIWIIGYKNKVWHTGTTDIADAIIWVLEQEAAGANPVY